MNTSCSSGPQRILVVVEVVECAAKRPNAISYHTSLGQNLPCACSDTDRDIGDIEGALSVHGFAASAPHALACRGGAHQRLSGQRANQHAPAGRQQ